MSLLGTGFDWDQGNEANCQKHGVSVAEIEAVFEGDPLVSPDLAHLVAEARFVAIGRNGAGRLVFVIFTLREIGGRRMIRPVSARYMREKECRRYGRGAG
jgi:uncharacterized DUF497 family protein